MTAVRDEYMKLNSICARRRAALRPVWSCAAGVLLGCIVLACSPGHAAIRLAVIASRGVGIEKLVPLVEVRLGKNKNVTLLDRASLTEILREHELQALVTAEGTAQRVAVGKLLKADLLAVFHGEDNPKPHVRLIVCESRYGLRLGNELIEVSENFDTEAGKIERFIDAAIKKHQEEIKEIVAVPPFVSRDLGFESQALQRPLASAIEQSLLGRPGVLVVELAEAKAVAGELSIAGDKNLERRLPLYVLGDFWQQRSSDGVKLSVRVRLVRGQQVIDEHESHGIALADLAATLRRDAAGLIDKAVGAATALPDPAGEAQQLAARAITMYQLMNFLECLELAEASLLLQPDRADVHRLAAQAAGMHVSKLLRQAATTWRGSADALKTEDLA